MTNKIGWLLVVVVLIGGVVWLTQLPDKPGELDTFASCVGEQGATFYGAFWCPHCQEQKALFGRSAKLLPYVECSTPDGRSQLPICNDAGIEGYPTWEFADESRISQVISLDDLAEITQCTLPSEDTNV